MLELSQFPKKEICHHQEIIIQFLFSYSLVSFSEGTFTTLCLTTCMCTIQFLIGNGASPVVIQPLLPYCPSHMTVYNPSIISEYAQLTCSFIPKTICDPSQLSHYKMDPKLPILPRTKFSCKWNPVLNTTCCVRSPTGISARFPPIPHLH